MKAITVETGGAVRWQDVPDPTCADGEVLVDIHATAVNRADLLQRAGQYPPPPGAPPYMGLEASGVIAEVGEGVEGWRRGDRVCALLAGGGYAERVAVPASLLMELPDDWSFERAAAIPEVFYTAFVNLFAEGGLERGESVLIHGGGSGVGTAAVQLAREAGCRAIVTAGRADKIEAAVKLGAAFGVNYKEGDFAVAIRAREPDGVDVILDIAAADTLARNLSLLKPKGRLVVIAVLSGTKAEVDLGLMLRRRLRIAGSVLRARSLDEKEEIHDRFEARFWPLLLDGSIQPVIYRTLRITALDAAHDILRRNENIGKVVLKVR